MEQKDIQAEYLEASSTYASKVGRKSVRGEMIQIKKPKDFSL